MEIVTVYKSNDIIIVVKPVGIPSQSDPTGTPDLMTETSGSLAALGEKSELWLIHRLDRNVGGLIVFARNKKSASELSRLVAAGEIEKKYFAVSEGEVAEGEYRDYLYKDAVSGKSYPVKSARKGAKEAILFAKPLAFEDGKTLLDITLVTGRFHQIRAQLSSRKNPLVGDKKYGSRDGIAKTPALFSYSLSFTLFGKRISATAMPQQDKYPWSLFDLKKIQSVKENL